MIGKFRLRLRHCAEGVALGRGNLCINGLDVIQRDIEGDDKYLLERPASGHHQEFVGKFLWD